MTGAVPPRPGAYAVAARPGAAPEAYLAFPFAPGDDAARAAAAVVAAGLDGEGALLERSLGLGAPPGATAPLAREASARVVGWPRAPALVVRLVAAQVSLDDAVMQVRALVDRIHRTGFAQPELDRANAARARSALHAALDPRARVVATWRGEPIGAAPKVPVSADDVRTFAAKSLAEEGMIVVASRPPRVTP